MLNVFLLLPQNDNAILEIIQDKNSYQQLIKEISDEAKQDARKRINL